MVFAAVPLVLDGPTFPRGLLLRSAVIRASLRTPHWPLSLLFTSLRRQSEAFSSSRSSSSHLAPLPGETPRSDVAASFGASGVDAPQRHPCQLQLVSQLSPGSAELLKLSDSSGATLPTVP